MRISTANATDSAIDTLMNRQREMAERQERLALGKRVARASDDPAAAARAERALAGELRAATSQRAVDASRTVVSQTETAMADGIELLQQAREAMVAAGNRTYTDAERQNLAAKLTTIREQLLQVANRSDGAGTYLFGGQGSSVQPFIDVPGGVQYIGTPGEQRTEPATGLPLSVDGRAVWMSGRTGNGVFVTAADPAVANAWIDTGRVSDPSALTGSGYTVQFSVSGTTTTYAVLRDGNPTAVTAEPYVPGREILVDGMSFAVRGAPANGDRFTIEPSTPTLSPFAALDRAIASLAAPNRSNAQVAQLTDSGLRDLDAAMTQLQGRRAVAGEVLQRIDNEAGRLDSQKLAAQVERSQAEDLDMVAAISDFQARQTGYDAALKSYSMVQRLSLFQYLSA